MFIGSIENILGKTWNSFESLASFVERILALIFHDGIFAL